MMSNIAKRQELLKIAQIGDLDERYRRMQAFCTYVMEDE